MSSPMFQCKNFIIDFEQLFYHLIIAINREIKSKEMTELDESTLKMIIRSAIKTVHGDKGLAATVDILKLDSWTNDNARVSTFRTPTVAGSTINARAYLRISANHLVIVQSSLALLTNYEGNNCTIRFNKICHSLHNLPLESRNCNYTVIKCI